MQALLEQNVLDLPIDDKRKLITQIVAGSGMFEIWQALFNAIMGLALDVVKYCLK